MSITDVAGKLASALRMMPCTCSYAGAWPTFKAEACVGEKSKHKLKTCARCESLALYDAHASIVQTPGQPQTDPTSHNQD
jgi:hypothetical protein